MKNASKFIVVVASSALLGALAFMISIGKFLSFNVRTPSIFFVFILFTAAIAFHQFYLKEKAMIKVFLRIWIFLSALFVPNILVFSEIKGLSEVAYFLSFLVSVLFAVMLQAQDHKRTADITLIFLSTVWIQLSAVILLKEFSLVPPEIVASFDAIGIETFKKIRIVLTVVLGLWIIGIAIGNAWSAPPILRPYEIPLMPAPRTNLKTNPVVGILQQFVSVLVSVIVNPLLITGIVNWLCFLVIRLIVDAFARVVKELLKKVRETLQSYYYIFLFLGIHILLILSAVWIRNLYVALEAYILTDRDIPAVLGWAACLSLAVLVIKTIFLQLFFIQSKNKNNKAWSILVANLRQSLADLTQFLIAVSLIVEVAAIFVWVFSLLPGNYEVKTWGPFFMGYLVTIGVIGLLVLGYNNIIVRKDSATQPTETIDVSYEFREITWQPVKSIWLVIVLFVVLVASFYLYPLTIRIFTKESDTKNVPAANTELKNQVLKVDTTARSKGISLAEKYRILLDAGEYEEAYKAITLAVNIPGIPAEDKKRYIEMQRVILELKKQKNKRKPKS